MLLIDWSLYGLLALLYEEVMSHKQLHVAKGSSED